MTDEPTPVETLLEFFHVCPVGLIAFDDSGEVMRANPAAASLLVPVFGPMALQDLRRSVLTVWEDLVDQVRVASRGRALNHPRVAFGEGERRRWLAFTAVRVGLDRNMLVVADVSAEGSADDERVRLLERERSDKQRLELLERNATHLVAAMTVEDLAESTFRDLRDALGMEVATLNVIEEGRLRILPSPAIRGLADRIGERFLESYLRGDIGQDLPGPEAIKTGEMVRFDSRDALRSVYPGVAATLAEFDVETLLAIPVHGADGTILGSLVMTSTTADWLDESTLGLLRGIGGQVGLAIERAQLYEQLLVSQREEREVALRLQQSLLPDGVVEHAALEISACYRAGATHLTVGGDWYDTYLWPTGHVGLLVGDVAGHNLDAAAAMGRIRTATAALAPRGDACPIALLEALESAVSTLSAGNFVTAAVAVLQPETGDIAYATAGHPPPLLVSPNGATRWLDDANTAPIGILGRVARHAGRTAIGPEDLLVLYSDGLVERRGEHFDTGLARLADTAHQVATVPLEQMPSRLVALLSDGHQVEDDIVVVTARSRSDGSDRANP